MKILIFNSLTTSAVILIILLLNTQQNKLSFNLNQKDFVSSVFANSSARNSIQPFSSRDVKVDSCYFEFHAVGTFLVNNTTLDTSYYVDKGIDEGD